MISGIVAMSKNWVIGREGALPWRLSEDLKRFKSLTMGHPIIMGRKTFESIGKVLPGRQNIVISRQEGFQIEGATVVPSLERALEVGRAQGQEVFIVGGGEIYRLALPLIQKLYLTLVSATIEGDAFFPVFDWNEWVELNREERVDPLEYSFITLERKAHSLE